MTVHLQYKIGTTGSWTTFECGDGGSSTPGHGVEIKEVLISYSQAARIDFTVRAPEQTQPLPRGAFVRMWDDVGLDESSSHLSAGNPLFVGSIINVAPGEDSNEVAYSACDPTYIASKGCTVMNLPYATGGVPATGAIPRLVFNVMNQSDDDYAFETAGFATLGQIIMDLLDFTKESLKLSLAAPPSGSPYVSTDFTNMTYVPQEKVVFETMTIRPACEQIWRNDPRYRMLFDPTALQWRFIQLNVPGVTPVYNLLMNDSGLAHGAAPPNPYPVIDLEINPVYENCFTAVSIYGPPNRANNSFVWDNIAGSAGLTPIGTPTIVQSYSDSGGAHNAQVYTTWQITDPTKRAGSRILPTIVTVGTGYGQGFETKFPVFMASWDNGSTWVGLKGAIFDFLNGTVTLTGDAPFVEVYDFGVPVPAPGSTQTKFVPTSFKLVWASYIAPLQVRYPSSGYAGTAFDNYGCAEELMLYDEALAVGYEYGTPVTTTTRLAAYQLMAQNIQSVRCDISYCGTVVLAGIDYSWRRLNRQVTISDANGALTGWESMFAPVTDVQYNYGPTPTTTLTFNADWLSMYGQDPAALRAKLRIRAMDQYRYSDYYGQTINTYETQTQENYDGSKSQVISAIHVQDPFVYRDAVSGSVERAIS